MTFHPVFFILIIILLAAGCRDSNIHTTTELNTSQVETNASKLVASLELKYNATLGEGAFWNHKTQELYWIDILKKQLHIYNPKHQTNSTFNLPSRIGTVVPQTDSTAVLALEDGIYIQNVKNGSLRQLSNVEANMPGNRFNDGKCDPNGNLWVGSMHLKETEAVAKLYRVSPDGVAIPMLDGITISNGIAWTKDAETMYYIDTPTGTIRAFDYNKEDATISNERIAVKVPDSLGFPDGMAIDSEDKLWVGMWNGNAVVRFDPITGVVMQHIEVPAHNVTSCAFGGPTLETLYITTASKDMTESEVAQFPLAGSLFSIKPGVKGVPSVFFGTTQE